MIYEGEQYEWVDSWETAPDGVLTMSHSSIAITRCGQVIAGAGTNPPALQFRTSAGSVERIVRPDGVWSDFHGITLVEESGHELLWVADTATMLVGGENELSVKPFAAAGRVAQLDLEGNLTRRLQKPSHPVYATGVKYRPTSVAVDERCLGGSGDIFVADGYGASLVHRFSADGIYVNSLSGQEGAGRFRQPHAVFIDRRHSSPELYVADRLNGRLQVFDLDGRYRRVVGLGVLPGPTQLATSGQLLVITDLLAGRVTLLDYNDEFLTHLFPAPSAPSAWDKQPDAWPNARDAVGNIMPFEFRDEEFRAPHGLAVGSDGVIYVSEFAIGERVTLLRPILDSAPADSAPS